MPRRASGHGLVEAVGGGAEGGEYQILVRMDSCTYILDTTKITTSSSSHFFRFIELSKVTKRSLDTMASYTAGGEQNVNRLINANASFTRQRDDARRTKQLAEERLNLVKKDSECDDIALIDLFITSGESMLFFLHLTIKNCYFSSILLSGEVEEKKIVSMEGQLREHVEKMRQTKEKREILESANGEITKNVSEPTPSPLSYVACSIVVSSLLIFVDVYPFFSTTSNTMNSHRKKKSSIVPRTNAKLTPMNVT